MANVILGLLLTVGPQTIYDLNKQFEAGVSLFYRASLGALRTALAGLLARGEVEVEELVERGRAKKRYSVTDAGRLAFADWMAAPITTGDPETAALAKTFFLALVPDRAGRLAVVDGILDRTAADAARLEALAERLDAAPPIDAASIAAAPMLHERAEAFRFQRATLDYGIGGHRHALEFYRRLRDELAAEPNGAGSGAS